MVNTCSELGRVRVAADTADGLGQAMLEAVVEPGQRSVRLLTLPGSTLRLESRQVRLKLTWNDAPLPPIADLNVWRADPLQLSAAPRGQSLDVTVNNAAQGAFAGKLGLRADGKSSDGPAVHILKGQAQAHLQLPLRSGLNQVFLVDDQGKPAAQTTAERFQPMTGFPAGSDPSSALDAVLFVDNSPQPPRPLKLAAASAGAPAAVAVEVSYHFDPGWRYLSVVPHRPLAIPDEAQAVVFWVRGNDSGDHLGARIRDATGQTFQPDLGHLDWSDWRPVRIEFGRRASSVPLGRC